VGKSTLVNALLGTEKQTHVANADPTARKTHHDAPRADRASPAARPIIDTPGMRELQLWSADDGLESAFDDISVLSHDCRFRDCVHEHGSQAVPSAPRSIVERSPRTDSRVGAICGESLRTSSVARTQRPRRRHGIT